MSDIIAVRFQKLGKLYHFGTNGAGKDIVPGDHVIVDTRRGLQLGQVVSFVDQHDVDRRRPMRSIDRKANPRDLMLQQLWEQRNLDALITCREMASRLNIDEARYIKAEYSFDGSWLSIFYSTESQSVDFKSLEQSLSSRFNSEVTMLLVGPRDVARILGGHGACGSPRCCSTFLTEFSPISIKMAKAQGISLSPQEITGMCGRLRCCLVFEYEQYVEAKKHLPRRGKKIITPHGEGIVRDVRVIRDSVMVLVEDTMHEVFRHEFEPLEELRALEKKAADGCSKHEDGQCDCGAAGEGSAE